jgi:hypothetical protein
MGLICRQNLGIEVNMGGTGKKTERPDRDDGKPGKAPSRPIADDDSEDGDFATPKRDLDDEDDQPL